jgi:hypothetical protein
LSDFILFLLLIDFNLIFYLCALMLIVKKSLNAWKFKKYQQNAYIDSYMTRKTKNIKKKNTCGELTWPNFNYFKQISYFFHEKLFQLN